MTVDVLAIGAHPDDVELGCGGTLARLVDGGRRVAILDLTRGEAGTRGTPETRAAEAAEAARILGATERIGLDLGDGDLATGRAAQLEVIRVIRRLAPRIVLAQHAHDRHADHVRASGLATEAAFYAGLRSIPGTPHRPQQVLYYASSYPIVPTFLVDVSATFDRKLASIRAYRSQFHDPDAVAEGPETYISTRGYFDGIAARARELGRSANVAYAEGLVSVLPPLVADPVAAFEGYEPGFPR